jgi:hypothetical protein
MLNRRRRKFVHPKIQLALALHSLRQWAFFLVAMFGLLCVLEYFNSGGQESMVACVFKMWGRYGPALVVLLFLLPSIIYDSIKMSNRFVGPLIRLRTAMQKVAQDEPVEPLKCRRKDCAEDFFTAFNEMLERVHKLEEQKREAVADEQPDDALATIP